MESADNVQGNMLITEVPEENGLQFPYLLEDGNLEVSALFQSDIPNPDKNFEEAENLASVEVVNKGNRYLERADIKIILEDETELLFQICDIPVGKTVWAFELNNTAIEEEIVCTEILCEAEFDEEYEGWEAEYQTTSEGAVAQITNLTDEEKQNLDLIFHCKLEEVYFGGISYNYTIAKILSEECTEIEVMECYFGDAELVKIGE